MGAGKAFAFVKYKTVSEAQSAIQALNQAQIGNSVLEVKLADADAGDRNPELCAPPSDNLYCKNLPGTYTEEELRNLFGQWGTVMECRVLHSGPGRDNAQGAGALVRMNSVEEASKAIAHLHNHRLQGTTIPLVVRYADSQEQKAKKAARQNRQPQARYANHHSMGMHGYSQQDLQVMHMPMVNSGLVYQGEPAYLGADQGIMGMMGGYASSGGPCSVYIKYLPEEVRPGNFQHNMY
jgi:RNA recognition motif-containing protein